MQAEVFGRSWHIHWMIIGALEKGESAEEAELSALRADDLRGEADCDIVSSSRKRTRQEIMNVTKEKLEILVKGLPDTVDIEEVMYRLYLLEKIEAGEAAIKEGKTLSHDDVLKRLSKKWQS